MVKIKTKKRNREVVKCDICQIDFSSPGALINHNRSIHDKRWTLHFPNININSIKGKYL